MRRRNLASKTNHLTMTLLASESVPDGQDPIPAVSPLLVRGPLDLESQRYDFTEFPEGSGQSWTLAPRDAEGSEVEVVLGVDRSAITNDPGSRLAGVLSFTDSLGLPAGPPPGTAPDGSSQWSASRMGYPLIGSTIPIARRMSFPVKQSSVNHLTIRTVPGKPCTTATWLAASP